MIIVLGCGPAGLLAAQAVQFATTKEPLILSIKKPSHMRGAMYVHKAIPEITYEPNGVLTYIKKGTKEGYAEKVYGDPEAPCSWEKFEGSYEFWSMPAVYEVLWSRFEKHIKNTNVDFHTVNELLKHPRVDLVVSSIPLKLICWDPGSFTWKSERVYISDSGTCDADTIVYNGEPDTVWYRMSNICGHRSTEYPGTVETTSLDGGFYVSKPLGTDFNPELTLGPRLFCVGRYGRWAKDEFVHDSFYDTLRKLGEMNL